MPSNPEPKIVDFSKVQLQHLSACLQSNQLSEITDAQLKALLRVHAHALDIKKMVVDNTVLVDVIQRFKRDQERLNHFHPLDGGPNHFKLAGYLLYWIAKLKPIRTTIPAYLSINEILGLAVAIDIILAGGTSARKFPDDIFNELIYTLYYRRPGQDELSLILRSIFSD